MRLQPLFLALLGSLIPVQGQVNITCPAAPSPLPRAASFNRVPTLPDPFLYLDGKTRVQSKEEWYQCRQPEIVHLLQEYQYGYYPDHSQERVTATRNGNTVSITVAAGGKTGSFSATISLPSGASASNKAPVVIGIGFLDNNAFLREGIAVVTFDNSRVSPDSNSKTGAFWSLYNGRDIGMYSAGAAGA